jgi:hypothetical protein
MKPGVCFWSHSCATPVPFWPCGRPQSSSGRCRPPQRRSFPPRAWDSPPTRGPHTYEHSPWRLVARKPKESSIFRDSCLYHHLHDHHKTTCDENLRKPDGKWHQNDTQRNLLIWRFCNAATISEVPLPHKCKEMTASCLGFIDHNFVRIKLRCSAMIHRNKHSLIKTSPGFQVNQPNHFRAGHFERRCDKFSAAPCILYYNDV